MAYFCGFWGNNLIILLYHKVEPEAPREVGYGEEVVPLFGKFVNTPFQNCMFRGFWGSNLIILFYYKVEPEALKKVGQGGGCAPFRRTPEKFWMFHLKMAYICGTIGNNLIIFRYHKVKPTTL